ncbi:MAG: single-stranded DNA-binding protein [Victivallales bacterium]|jgi:single-strand DNA-binding protein|nr:single-stranded DNA-binding protein [Victivallales bacterium]
MASLNKVFLLGNLTRDPDLRALPSGKSVCEFGIAVNRRYLSNGQEIDEPCFVDIVVWGGSAENCKQYLEKGSQIMVEGRLQLDQWEDRNGGGKRSRLRVVAEQVQFLSRRPGNDAPHSDNQGYADNGVQARRQDGYQSRPASGGMPRSAQSGQGGASRFPQPEMPPMPDNAYNPDVGTEDDIPF